MALRGPRTLRLLFGLAVAGATCTLFAAARPLAAASAACTDDDAALAALAAENGKASVKGCWALKTQQGGQYCTEADVKAACCQTCRDLEPTETVMGRVDLPASYPGRALDGSAAIYYYAAPAVPDKDENGETLWIIDLKGGGQCEDPADCAQRSKTKLGSSTFWGETQTRNGLFSNNAATNPDFARAHKVYVPYLSGDGWVGSRTKPMGEIPDYANAWAPACVDMCEDVCKDITEDQNSKCRGNCHNKCHSDDLAYPPMHLSGHTILESIVQHLAATQPDAWSSASRILFTGCSAGGAGVYTNAEWLQTVVPVGAVVKAAASAGSGTAIMLDQTYEEFKASHDANGNPTLPRYSHTLLADLTASELEALEFLQGAADPHRPAACVAAQPAGRGILCMQGVVSAPFTNEIVPIYMLESQFDFLATGFKNLDGLPDPEASTAVGLKYKEYAGDTIRALHQGLGSPVFSVSCTGHCSGYAVYNTAEQLSLVGGLSAQDLLLDWFFERDVHSTETIEQRYPDGQPGNPTCEGAATAAAAAATPPPTTQATMATEAGEVAAAPTGPAATCTDDDEALREIAFEYGVKGVSGCAAVRSRKGSKYCNNPRVKEACCASCQ